MTMEEKKLRPFNLERAKQGKPVCTRDGHKARIICFDAKCNLPITALITGAEGNESLAGYNFNGKFMNLNESDCDLMMLPEKKEGWVNIFRGIKGWAFVGSDIYDTIQQAKEDASNSFSDLIDTIKIEWEE